MGLLLILLATVSGPSRSEARSHLAAGHELYQAGRFEDALAQYQRASRLGAKAEASWQIGVTLTHLGRVEDAVEVFARARTAAPNLEKPVQRFFRAVACMQTRLWSCADDLLGSLDKSVGKGVTAHVATLQQAVMLQEKVPYTRAMGRWYEQRADAAEAQGRVYLAKYYREEARAFSERLRLRRGQGLLDPLAYGATQGKVSVMTFVELGYDTNPLLLPASAPEVRSSTLGGRGGVAGSAMMFAEARPFGLSGPFAQVLANLHAENRGWFDEVALFTGMGTAGWRVFRPGSDLSASYTHQRTVLNGEALSATHRARMRVAVEVGPVWLETNLQTQYDQLLQERYQSFSGFKHALQSGATFMPLDPLRITATYRGELLLRDLDGVVYLEHGPQLEAELTPLPGWSVGLIAGAWTRSFPEGSPLAGAIQSGSFEATLVGSYRPSETMSLRLAVSSSRALYGGRGEHADRLTATVGVTYFTHFL